MQDNGIGMARAVRKKKKRVTATDDTQHSTDTQYLAVAPRAVAAGAGAGTRARHGLCEGIARAVTVILAGRGARVRHTGPKGPAGHIAALAHTLARVDIARAVPATDGACAGGGVDARTHIGAERPPPSLLAHAQRVPSNARWRAVVGKWR